MNAKLIMDEGSNKAYVVDENGARIANIRDVSLTFEPTCTTLLVTYFNGSSSRYEERWSTHQYDFVGPFELDIAVPDGHAVY